VATEHVISPQEFDLKLTAFNARNYKAATFDYDAVADTLVFTITSDSLPTVGFALDDFFLLRVDPATREIVGVEIEHFVKAAVYEHPILFGALEFVENPPREVAKLRKRLEAQSSSSREANTAATKRGLMDAIRIIFESENHRAGSLGPVHP
jgi:hypothetical protein